MESARDGDEEAQASNQSKGRYVYMGVRITPLQYKFLSDFSRINNIKRSVLVRKAIDQYINNYTAEVKGIEAKLERIDAKLDLIINEINKGE